MMKQIFIFAVILALAGTIAFTVFAQTRPGLVQCSMDAPCTFCELLATAQAVLNFMLKLAALAAGIGIIIGGLLIMMAGGNPALYQKGILALKAAAIGLIIALSAWVIINTIINRIATPSALPWPWNQVRCQ